MAYDLVKRLRFLASGQDDPHSLAITEAASRIEELQTLVEVLLPPRRWDITDLVKKKSGAKWHGRVVGFYSTELTPIGYCVESAFEENSVQIYPESALEAWNV